jgi:hypothetical protein
LRDLKLGNYFEESTLGFIFSSDEHYYFWVFYFYFHSFVTGLTM